MKKENTILRLIFISLFIGTLSPILQAHCFTWIGFKYISIGLLVSYILLTAYTMWLVTSEKSK